MNTLEEVQAFIRRANAFAEAIAKEGFKFTYHNHHMEYRRLQGKTIMEHLADGLDPATTSFVLDTYWVQVGGGDVRRELERLAGRIDILHLKDLWLNPDGSHQSTEIGNGNLWWEGILPLAKETGVRYFVVEQEEFTMDPMESMRRSAAYLQSL